LGPRTLIFTLSLVATLAVLPAAGQKSWSSQPQSQSALTTRSPHGPLNIACQNCHTLEGWKPIRAVPEFDHNTTRFPLRGLHQGVTCTQCHTKPVFTNVGHLCAECHADLHRGKLGANCEQCHSVRGWKVQAQQIKDHNNRFPLLGAHAAVECDSCHKNGGLSNYTTMPTDCYSCHAKEFQTAQPNHAQLKFPTDCTQCHGMDNWLGAKFDHLKFTGFALTGAHATLDCVACHLGGKYTGTPATCAGCHLNDFNKTNNPSHVQAGFPQTCQTCHSTAAWNPATFDHSTFTKFPLTGAHANVACTQCHVNGQFVGTPTDCFSCHQKDYMATTAPNHAQAGKPTTCAMCHDTAQWTDIHFSHAAEGWALTGAHATISCEACHINNNYNITNTTCSSCHLKDFQNTNNPNHAQAGIPQTCEQCHTTANWATTNFDHSTTGFPLTGTHVSTPCANCHVNNNYNLTSANAVCVSCHLKDFQGTTQPNHVQANMSQTCQQCHNTTSWANATFDHSTTGWPLTGAHTSLQCALCHTNGNYGLTTANTTCVSCHLTDFNNTTNPNHAQQGFPQTCEQCHTTASWLNATFNHNNTGFPLTGAHTTLQCAQCHVNNNYNLTSTACVTCHLNDYKGTTQPNHVQANMPQTCEQCHSTTNWGNASFDHSTTGFPLTGAHTTLLCSQCHINGNYNLTSANTACVSCHQTDFNNTNNPSHVQAQFPTSCQSCHNTTSWGNATFDHSTTGWPLTGFHLTMQCVQCHVNGNYNLTSANTACVSCHQTDFNNTTNPNHVQAKFPTTCQNCHNTTSWGNATFDHSTTGFPLTGFHTTLQCVQCHINGNYNLTSANTACVSCHQTDFNNTNNPPHVAAGFPTTCQNCHTTTNWGNGTFDHSTTGFPLTGFHTTLQCQQCHVNGNYNLTSANTACISCHQNDYNGTNNPPHAAAGFPTTCQTCHSTTNWLNATFDHSTTGFALTGFHATMQCSQCHVNNNYKLTSGACVTCHLNDYNGTTNPNHVQAGFPTTCDQCHSTTNWGSGTFDHSTTGWALTGFHLTMACQQCHVNGNYKLTSANTVCVSCHQTDYNNTNNPNHAQVGFPTTCDVCHSTTNWSNASFNHNNTTFPLTGAHTTVACTLCHVNNNYTTLPTDCYGCHSTDYNGTTNPNHKSAGFPTTCATCHTTTSWAGATFNHTWWPTNHGGANGVCATCHTNPNDYSVFQCTNCHQKAQTDQNHQGVNGYVYNSVNCYQCHKNGGGG
jgi:hypothetical protein